MEKLGVASVGLPTDVIYRMLEGGMWCQAVQGERHDCCQQMGGNVGAVLEEYLERGKKENLAEIIEQNYCVACATKGDGDTDGTNYYDPCEFFYYWLGDQIKDKLKNVHDFKNVMGAIYDKLLGGKCKEKFNELYEDVSEIVFPESKILFDYNYDYNYLNSKKGSNEESLCEELNGKLGGAQGAHDWLCQKCETPMDKYCKEFIGDYGTVDQCKARKPQALPELKCTARPQESALLLQQGHQEDILDKWLPSKIAYHKLEKGKKGKCEGRDSSYTQGIRNSENTNTDMEGYAEEFAEHWCYVPNERKEHQSDDSPCYYLYYYLGDMIRNNSDLNNSSFRSIMSTVREELQKLDVQPPCKIVPSNIGKTYFDSEKKVYDYHLDHNTIQGKFQSVDSSCSPELNEYLSSAATAYGIMNEYCPKNDESTEYCTKFRDEYSKHNLGVELISKCTSAQELKEALSGKAVNADSKFDLIKEKVTVDAEAGVDSTADSVTTGVISGGIATIGIPTIGFFLYKYTDVFDGIKKSLFGGSNNTGGRSRGRRSTVRHNQHFDDTFTGNDSSTLGDGSTTLGGGGGGSSTLGGSSTDVSTIYNDDDGGRRRRPSTGRRERAGTNNRRPGNIRYYAT
ncbi:KIR protein [Plasmodium knowlesi strain H]|uniref:KIR protein n=2 Tax=Plasmodium knowlesi TaxID=5850 RepID=B3LD43_PLAKH|nr:KIR protein [Plasmodium knowlesi strain H]OTN64227.1 KIR protein [Plasmodium knowlesi]CAA9991191.1 KIR protein [Plasmodium knowlesi strain H]VVS80665.1 KIR protein [Plasmodium knowlesi strain H]|eukprot:XP_002262474.1 KIR protein [Plasmodium knowlesi strain H]